MPPGEFTLNRPSGVLARITHEELDDLVRGEALQQRAEVGRVTHHGGEILAPPRGTYRIQLRVASSATDEHSRCRYIPGATAATCSERWRSRSVTYSPAVSLDAATDRSTASARGRRVSAVG